MAAPSIVPFIFGDMPLRVIERDDQPWFVLIDVCRAIEHSNPSQAAASLDDDEKMTIRNSEGHSGQRGGAQSYIIINEGGLYSLVLRSSGATTPGTVQHRFRKWVTAEVLPAIRKTGAYVPPPVKKSDQELAHLREKVGHLEHIINLQTQLFQNTSDRHEAYITAAIVRILVRHSDLDDATIAEAAKSEIPYVAYIRQASDELIFPPA